MQLIPHNFEVVLVKTHVQKVMHTFSCVTEGQCTLPEYL